MNKDDLILTMNNNRKEINRLEEEDWQLGVALLEAATTEEDCLYILQNLDDSITRMYVADKLRMIRKLVDN